MVVLGGLGWLVLAATSDGPWSEAVIYAGIWVAIAWVGWQAPAIGALLSFVGAVLGGLLALVFVFVSGLEQIGVKNPHDNTREVWGFFGWWMVLPLAAALLFAADVRRRVDDR